MSSEGFSCLECPICLSTMEAPVMLACQHSFCWRCLKKYMDSDGRMCPVCRRVIQNDNEISRNLTLEQLLSELNKGGTANAPPDRPNNFVRPTNETTRTNTIPDWLPIAGAAAASFVVGIGAALIGTSIARKSKK